MEHIAVFKNELVVFYALAFDNCEIATTNSIKGSYNIFFVKKSG